MPERNVVSRYSSIANVIDTLTRRELSLLNPSSWIDKNDSQFVEFYRQYKGAPAVYAACFTLSNETFHHWYVFGRESAGAYLEFDTVAQEAHLGRLKKEGHKLRYESVQYFTLSGIGDPKISLDQFPFAKRWGFQAEKEYRIIIESEAIAVSCQIPVPLRAVARVVINPWLSKDVVHSIRSCIHSIEGCEMLRVDHSRLIDSDKWQAAGIRRLSAHLRKTDPAYKNPKRRRKAKKKSG
jgi:hypothetical protein